MLADIALPTAATLLVATNAIQSLSVRCVLGAFDQGSTSGSQLKNIVPMAQLVIAFSSIVGYTMRAGNRVAQRHFSVGQTMCFNKFHYYLQRIGPHLFEVYFTGRCRIC